MADKGTIIHLSDIPDKGLLEGAEVRFVHSESMSVAFWNFEGGTRFAMHTHPHEQISHCIEGEFELIVGEDTFHMGAGDVVLIPSGISHGGGAITNCRIIDVFHPVREDYRQMTFREHVEAFIPLEGTHYDVIVAGAGPAGVAAAMSSACSCTPRNLPVTDLQSALRGMGVHL